MHIMFIPSWYSNERIKVHGSFFKEQALALQKLGIKISIAYNEIWPITMFGKIKEKRGLQFAVEDNLRTYRYKEYNYFPKNKAMFNLFNKRMEKLYHEIIKKEGKVSIIHAQSSLWGGISAAYIAKKYNIPFIITEHSSLKKAYYLKKSYIPLIIDSYKVADKLITVGNGLKNEIEHMTNRKDIEVIGNLINFQNFKIKTKDESKEKKFTFFSLAYLEGEKGFDTLIKAFSKSFLYQEDVILLIGGDGSQKKQLKALCEEYKVEEKVVFLGALSREEVAKYMQEADAFVLPSRYETFGVVYIEALASGTPIIGTYNGGAEDIINKNNGYIVNIDNVEELSKAMLDINKNIKSFNGEELRENCYKKFSEEIISNKIKNIYKELIKE